MRGIIYGALLALTVTPANTQVDAKSANNMLPYCKLVVETTPAGKAFGSGLCVGVVESARETFELLKNIDYKGWFCADIPDNVTNEQALRVIVKYAEQHPDCTHYSLYMLSLEALLVTWPCKK